MENSQGIAYFHAGKESKLEITEFKLYLFDGLWESNNLYKISFNEAYYDPQLRSIESDSCSIKPEQNKFDDEKCLCKSAFNFTLNGEAFNLDGYLKSENCGLDIRINLQELNLSAKQEPVVTYSFIVSCTAVLLIFGFARHTQDCSSENVAKKTSILMLGMQATIDMFFCLYHCRLAITNEESFDYLMLASFWSFAVFMIIQGRLTLLV